jgi:hypothetical protein
MCYDEKPETFMCEPVRPQNYAIIGNRTSGVFIVPAQAGIQISQSPEDAAFAGMTGVASIARFQPFRVGKAHAAKTAKRNGG